MRQQNRRATKTEPLLAGSKRSPVAPDREISDYAAISVFKYGSVGQKPVTSSAARGGISSQSAIIIINHFCMERKALAIICRAEKKLKMRGNAVKIRPEEM